MLAVQDRDLPALFRVADRVSNQAQHRYLQLIGFDLALLVVGAFATSWAFSYQDFRVPLYVLGACALLGSLVLTVIVLQTRPDKEWFIARAMAESTKTMAWRYMTRAEPYTSGLSAAEADQLFRQALATILQDHESSMLGKTEVVDGQITRTMREARDSSLEDRKNMYLRQRIKDQQVWYATKAESNAKASRRWLLAVGLAQLGGVIAIIVFFRWTSLPLNFASVLAVLAMVFIVWMHLRQYRNRATAYGMAARELGLVAMELPHIKEEAKLAAFIADAERSISRKHTMWIARRDDLSDLRDG